MSFSGLSLLLVLTALFANVDGSLYDFVTCGSVIKLLNADHNVRLHSHEVKYGSGSGQQSVTGVDASDDANSYWRVRARTGVSCLRGAPVKCGSTIRLSHVATGRNLHTHHFSSPISNQQEVSAFGDSGEGDGGDDWRLVCDSGEQWQRSSKIRLRHVVTDQYLHVSGQRFGRPIAGQAEICAVPSPSYGSYWLTAEGIYVKPSNDPNAANNTNDDEDDANSAKHDSSDL